MGIKILVFEYMLSRNYRLDDTKSFVLKSKYHFSVDGSFMRKKKIQAL